MIISGKNRIALEALHQLIIRVKVRTGYKEPYEETFNLLDEIEYLPVLMLDEKDRTQEFEEYLKGSNGDDLARDWRNVGNDLRMAMKRFKRLSHGK